VERSVTGSLQHVASVAEFFYTRTDRNRLECVACDRWDTDHLLTLFINVFMFHEETMSIDEYFELPIFIVVYIGKHD
jgi:hypothetical protein